MYRTCSRDKGRKVDYKHLLALFNHVLQLLINLLFWTRDLLPSLMAAPSHGHVGLGGFGEDGEGGVGGEGGEEGFGLFLTLQSWAVVLHFARMVFVLRGFLEFGSLVHMVEARLGLGLVAFIPLLPLIPTLTPQP